MGIREAGSYTVDKAGKERLVERTEQPPGHSLEEIAVPEVPTAPATLEASATEGTEASEPAKVSRKRGSETTNQE